MDNFWHTELNGAGGPEHDHAGHSRLDQEHAGLGELGYEDYGELHHESEIHGDLDQYRAEHGDLGQDHVEKRVFSSFNIGHARSKQPKCKVILTPNLLSSKSSLFKT